MAKLRSRSAEITTRFWSSVRSLRPVRASNCFFSDRAPTWYSGNSMLRSSARIRAMAQTQNAMRPRKRTKKAKLSAQNAAVKASAESQISGGAPEPSSGPRTTCMIT